VKSIHERRFNMADPKEKEMPKKPKPPQTKQDEVSDDELDEASGGSGDTYIKDKF
jgi:hypothetical protein